MFFSRRSAEEWLLGGLGTGIIPHSFNRHAIRSIILQQQKIFRVFFLFFMGGCGWGVSEKELSPCCRDKETYLESFLLVNLSFIYSFECLSLSE